MSVNFNNLYGTSTGGNGINVGAGISGDMLQSWSMLGANTKAYKKLLKEQQNLANGGSTGSKGNANGVLNSDKYFNDYYDPEKGEIVAPTYKPISKQTPELDEEKTSGDHLTDMRALALAAAGGSKMNSTHYAMFQKYYNHIAGNLVTGKETNKTEVEKEAATNATMEAKDLYRYLVDEQSFTIAGDKGDKTYTFGVGTSIEDIAKAINADSEATGVLAEAVVGEDGNVSLTLTSASEGKKAFIRVDQLKGDMFAAEGASKSVAGKDAVIEEVEDEVTGDDTQAAMVAGMYKGKLFEDVAFTLQGAKGQQSFKFEKGATAQEIATAINDAAEKTGVKAEVIFNPDTGEAEGIGLLADKRGVGNYVQATMHEGSLFTTEGKTVSVAGSSKGKGGEGKDATPAITSLQDLGQVVIDGVTYSFADLATGGKASLEKNPDAALAVIDQAIKEIYNGLAVVDGFDPKETYIPGVTNTSGGATAPTNTLEFDNYGSKAMTDWLNKFKPSSTSK